MTAATVRSRRTQTDDLPRRYWSNVHHCPAVYLKPGECHVSGQEEMIITMLGSCIAVCMHDSAAAIGGMNHFMLPATSAATATGHGRYGDYAMAQLVQSICSQGGRRQHLQVKIFGGGSAIASDIGRLNIAFAHACLDGLGLAITAEDVGGPFGRKLLYFPASGRALVKRQPIAERSRERHG